jgi:hypothetical protein
MWVKIFEGLEMEKIGIFYGPLKYHYGYLEYITGIWYILWTFGNLVAAW